MKNLRSICIYVIGIGILTIILLYDGPSLFTAGNNLWNKVYGIEHFVHMVPTNYLGRLFKSQAEQRIGIVVVIMGHTGIDKYQKAMPHILPFYDYILFLDADFGVVNPKRRIEEYVDPKVDIIFYDRFFNWEIMAGSYLAKNSSWSMNFLLNFARYEERLPNSFHGTDNGALHAYVAEVVLGENNANLIWCLDIYNKSKNFDDLFAYEACIRTILGDDIYLGRIKILPKGTAWARDNWITNSLWNLERDFIIHGWKEDQLSKYYFTPVSIVSESASIWYNPLEGSINMSLCTPGNTSWRYDRNLLVDRSEIDNRLQSFAQDVENRKAAVIRTLEKKNMRYCEEVKGKEGGINNSIEFYKYFTEAMCKL